MQGGLVNIIGHFPKTYSEFKINFDYHFSNLQKLICAIAVMALSCLAGLYLYKYYSLKAKIKTDEGPPPLEKIPPIIKSPVLEKISPIKARPVLEKNTRNDADAALEKIINGPEKRKRFPPLSCDWIEDPSIHPKLMNGKKNATGGQQSPSMQDSQEFLPQTISTIDKGKTFLYLKQEEIRSVSVIKKESYCDAVTQLPICCVDIFLFNPMDCTYFLVLRKDPPAKGIWWLPGGRLYKGESFFDCSQRKCKDEVGLEVTPIKTIGFAATLFPDSMWNTQTHTVNTLVLAIVNDQQKPSVDKTCETFQWIPINSAPQDQYVNHAYKKALKVIKKNNLFQK